MEQPENLTLAEGAQTTPNFDFLLDTPPQTALAEHRAWLKSIKHERPQPDCQSGARYARPARHLPQDLFSRGRKTLVPYTGSFRPLLYWINAFFTINLGISRQPANILACHSLKDIRCCSSSAVYNLSASISR